MDKYLRKKIIELKDEKIVEINDNIKDDMLEIIEDYCIQAIQGTFEYKQEYETGEWNRETLAEPVIILKEDWIKSAFYSLSKLDEDYRLPMFLKHFAEFIDNVNFNRRMQVQTDEDIFDVWFLLN